MKTTLLIAVCVLLASMVSASFLSKNEDSLFGGKKCETPRTEIVPEGEDKAINEVAEIAKAMLIRDTKPGAKMARDAHPRGWCLRAQMSVDENVPAQFRAGLFKNVGKTFDAIVRVSAGNPDTKSDSKNDSRGFAVKVITPEGNQDFVGANHHSFFLKSAHDYVNFFKGVRVGLLGILKFFVLHGKFRELLAVKNFLGNEMGHALRAKYFSATPYLLGGEVVKYHWKPVDCKTGSALSDVPKSKEDHFLRRRAYSSLSNSDMCYDFLVQKQEDPCTEPIEDPIVQWTTSFVKIGRLTFPKQKDFGSVTDQVCENYSFNPWRKLAGWKPLGSINRTRKVVYDLLSDTRHNANGVKREEPTELPAHWR